MNCHLASCEAFKSTGLGVSSYQSQIFEETPLYDVPYLGK